MNGDGVFDEQTDFSFLGLEESAPASKKQSNQRKDRSVQVGDICIDIRLTFHHSEKAKAKISACRKGVPTTEATKAKISATKAAKAQPFMTPLGPVLTKREASKIFGVDYTTIRYWELKYPQHFYYITKD